MEGPVMPTKPILKFTAWSYSRLHDYDECPARASYKHLQKIPEGPKGPALLRGSEIHKLAENFGTGRLKKLPVELKLFAEEFAELVKHKRILQVEQQLALDASWQPSDWFGPQAWLRAVLDACYADKSTFVVRDYKTGRVKPENIAQLDLYALVGFAYHEEVETVDAALWYTDAGEVNARNYVRADVPRLQREWTRRTKKMLADTTFKPKPGNACRWCPYTKGKGGPCRF